MLCPPVLVLIRCAQEGRERRRWVQHAVPQRLRNKTRGSIVVDKHNRRSVRLQGFDYSTPGAYFLTICTKDLRHAFGEVMNGEMHLSAEGKLVQAQWEGLPAHFPHIDLDEFVVMPNHVHGIVLVTERPSYGLADRGLGTVAKGSIPVIVRSFKSAATREVRLLTRSVEPLWQRNYYEHVVRTEASLQTLREYISENPLKWELDEHNIRR